jgi:multiple sugar transport system permease protein
MLAGYLFIAPNLVSILVFVAGPVLAGLVLSFMEWDLLSTPIWVGLDNYIKMFTKDNLFWKSLWNSIYYSILTIPVGIGISLILAILVNRDMPGINFFKSALFLPVVSAITAIALVWKWLYNPEFGIFNYILELLGLPPLDWLNDPRLAMPSIALMSIWKNMGYNMVILLAGLKGIPRQLYEASAIDGASGWTTFRYITVPLLTPVLFFVFVTSTIGSLQVFGEVYVMTEGGPANATMVYNYLLYQNAFVWFKMGYASALGYFLFLLILLLTLGQLRFMGQRVNYDL